MKPFVQFWFFFAGCALLAALLAPWLYLGAQAAAAATGWPWAEYLARHPFHRYFNRVLQVSLLAGIWPLLRSAGFLSASALGLKGEKPLRMLGLGFLLSAAVLGAYGILCVWLGYFSVRGDAAVKWGGLWGAVVLVSFLEEVFFRGYFLGLSRRALGWRAAVLVNALFFAAVHYIKPPSREALGPVDAASGFKMLALGFQRFAEPSQLAGGLLVLAFIAVLLCWSVRRTGGLYLAIGIHGGLIAVQQLHMAWTTCANSHPVWVLGNGDLAQGAVTLLPLACLFLILRGWLGRKAP